MIGTTLPVKISPTFASRVSASTMLDRRARSPLRRRRETNTVPSSSTSIFVPVSSWMPRMFLPPGPISAPIFSVSILIRHDAWRVLRQLGARPASLPASYPG